MEIFLGHKTAVATDANNVITKENAIGSADGRTTWGAPANPNRFYRSQAKKQT